MNAITHMLSAVAFALGICLGAAAGWMIGYTLHKAWLAAKLHWINKMKKENNHD